MILEFSLRGLVPSFISKTCLQSIEMVLHETKLEVKKYNANMN